MIQKADKLSIVHHDQRKKITDHHGLLIEYAFFYFK